ncbi:Crp/Fnr family transcriptional regulator [Orrella daihaiensis]|uniref:Crp/Fnr family transcriptional regulator n=1 Tax=Orrella daihaiensis TaxID=2782176 RepID=A0ABY4AJG5_9BURK|nr:Crp/Fnr family transcriptional regulator [Orrella daihaiensis]UOD50429.1 Crp/Fnr family transcriptional regulator [Orrella daihaiensis]
MSISVSLLNSLPFFQGLDDSQKEEFCGAATLRSFKSGTQIGRAGEIHDAIAYVISGQLQCKELADDGRVVSLSVMGPGAWVGWLAIVDQGYVSEEILCLTTCQLMTFPTRQLKTLVQTNAVLLNRFLGLAATNIKAARAERMMLTLPNAFQRICFQISNLSGEFDPETLERISALPRQQELASAANTSRETVSRTLQLLIKAGVIHKTGHRVVVRRLDLLKRLAYDGPESLLPAETQPTKTPETIG